MRVAIVTESFMPQVNGVTTTVRHVVDELLRTGHEPLLVAPGPGLTSYRGVQVVRVRSVSLPGYRSVHLGLPDHAVHAALARFAPDLVHLASPVSLGASGLRAARRLGLPTVAVYETDLAGYARRYGVHASTPVAKWVGRIHRRADRTLAPSRASIAQLESMGVTDVHRWGRGVDLRLFGPVNRNARLHDHWARSQHPGGAKVVVGYVGRLVPEKRVRRLVEVAAVPGTRVVAVGEGPERPWLESHLPGAKLTGALFGRELAQAYASLDLFVHTGETETFCQTIQEAQASGVPVVAPASGGPLDLVDHARTGLLYDPADRRSLRHAVATLVGDAGLRRALADNARQQVAGRSWATLVEELVEEHYAAVLRGRQAAGRIRLAA